MRLAGQNISKMTFVSGGILDLNQSTKVVSLCPVCHVITISYIGLLHYYQTSDIMYCV